MQLFYQPLHITQSCMRCGAARLAAGAVIQQLDSRLPRSCNVRWHECLEQIMS
jgi:hypothetical protein